MTELEPTPRPQPDRAPAALPPDPVAYDDVRNVHARARGLDAPYIAGGTDPDPVAGLREERYYGKLLLGMVIAIVLAGFVVGTILALVAAAS